MTDFRQRQPNSPDVKPLPGSPEVRPLPPVIWSRLYYDLAPYLTERSADGTALLGFYHRQLADAVNAAYLGQPVGRVRHEELASYFAFPPAPNVLPVRCLDELPYQQTLAEQWDDVFQTLTNFQFLEQKAAEVGVLERTDAEGNTTKTYTGVYLLQDDYALALRLMPKA